MPAVLLLCLALLRGPDLHGALAAGDDAFDRIQYDDAIVLYESALAGYPDAPELLWRLARVFVCAGEVAPDEDRQRFFLSAERYARRCIAADSLCAPGHTWLAGALGYLALDEGMARQVTLAHEVSVEAHCAIALDPSDDAAYSIIGSLYRALGNAGWVKRALASLFIGSVPNGGYDDAEEALKSAIRLAPGIMRHQYELGVLYMDMGRTEDARAALTAAVALPVRTAIDRPRLARARALLGSMPSR
jgi:tetratricopeptide (TPR) repeat protein